MPDRRAILTRAVDEALRRRGAATLAIAGGEHKWCAGRASVQGHFELRVGEPARGPRDFLARRWLARHEFTPGAGGWARPLPPGAGLRTPSRSSPARAYVDDGSFVVAVRSPDEPGAETVLGRFELSADGVRDASERLGARLRRDVGCAPGEPLFIGLCGVTDPVRMPSR